MEIILREVGNLKRIGDLEIPLPLYNIYLAETDEIVRLLTQDFGEWRHEPHRLRICLTCGNVGCCDSSEGRHAEAHHRRSGHPVIRSFEEDETWRWCYVDEELG